jgi:hypothetical protein
MLMASNTSSTAICKLEKDLANLVELPDSMPYLNRIKKAEMAQRIL